jgi:hypothetical protein
MAKRRNKPSAPRVIDGRNPENWGAEIPALPAHADTEANRDAKGRVVSAWRSNVANRLFKAKAIGSEHVAAFQGLCEAWAGWKGLDGSSGHAEKVDGGSGCVEIVNDHMIRCGREVERDLSSVGPQTRALLKAFCVATVEEDRPMMWRGIVERVTGEAREREQRDKAVYAFEELALVRQGVTRRAA